MSSPAPCSCSASSRGRTATSTTALSRTAINSFARLAVCARGWARLVALAVAQWRGRAWFACGPLPRRCWLLARCGVYDRRGVRRLSGVRLSVTLVDQA
jgi:hypothetical protein